MDNDTDWASEEAKEEVKEEVHETAYNAKAGRSRRRKTHEIRAARSPER